MTTRKNPGLGARAQAMAAAVAASTQTAPETDQQEAAEETIGMSLRLPLSVHRRLSDISHELKRQRGPQRKSRGDVDPLSVHGLIKTAISEYLAKQRPS